MRALTFSVMVAGSLLLIAACGESESNSPDGSAGQSSGGAAAGQAGAASAGKGGASTSGGASGSGSGAGTSSGGASGGAAQAGSASGGSAGAAGAATGGAGGLVDCDPRKILCKRIAPECGAMEVPSVDGSCYGECVKIDRCACDSPDACPDNNQYTCLNSAKHCSPYLK